MCSCELRSAAVSSKLSVSLDGPIGVRCGYGAGGRTAVGRDFFAGVLYGEMVTESPNRGHREKDGRIIDGGHAL